MQQACNPAPRDATSICFLDGLTPPLVTITMSESPELDSRSAEFYAKAMSALQESDIPFLLGGAYALARYTGITRHTKDLDLFVRARHLDGALKSLHDVGYETEVTYPHWLAKVYEGDASVDLIFASGNGLWTVDDTWFDRSTQEEVLGVDVRLCPPEEIVLMKAFIMERERFDGADIAHLLRECVDRLDWDHLLNQFGSHWRVLYGHLILFGYIYPSRRHLVPRRIMRAFARRLEKEGNEEFKQDVCRGTLLSRAQYLSDVENLNFHDAREWPTGSMTESEIEDWTAAIEDDE